MELSPVQSSARSPRSDFSIERILSDEPRSRQTSAPPSWLCCSRYRPPKLPRASSSSCRPRRSGRHARVPFTAAQASALESAYARAPYMAPPALRALAAALQLRDDRIKIWFQNRRARERRERCSTISPPLAVTLPATSLQQAGLSHTDIWATHVDATSRPGVAFSVAVEKEALHLYSSANYETCNRLLNDEISSESNDERADTPLDIETVDE